MEIVSKKVKLHFSTADIMIFIAISFNRNREAIHMSGNPVPFQANAYNPQHVTQKWTALPATSRIDLSHHEKTPPPNSGGHTLQRHVGLTVAQLISRFPGIEIAATFMDRNIAEVATSEWFNTYFNEFLSWYNNPHSTEARFAKELLTQDILGTYIANSDPSKIQYMSKKFTLVMKATPHNSMPHHILTAFPIPE